MHCPNCNEVLFEEIFNRQTILHCKTCGGSFFQQYGINKITERTAERLANDRKSDFVYGVKKLCPTDQTELHLMRHSELTREADLFRCEKCHGIFVYPQDLLQFKKSQNIILEYFKILHKKLPSPAIALALSFLLIISTAILTTRLYKSGHTVTTQANEIITESTVFAKNARLSIDFKTKIYVRSKVLIVDPATGKRQTLDVSTFPAKDHHLDTAISSTSPAIGYQLILVNLDGKEIKTPQYTLPTK